MGLSFLSLLYLQVSYIEEMVKMRREHFDESVQRSLEQACRNVELVETRKYLEADAVAIERAAQAREQALNNEAHVSNEEVVEYTQSYYITSPGGLSGFEWTMKVSPNVPKMSTSAGKNIPQTAKTLQMHCQEAIWLQRQMLQF